MEIMKYQVLYNTYVNSSMMEVFKHKQDFIIVESHNKKDAENKARHILFQKYDITPWKIINVMKLNK